MNVLLFGALSLKIELLDHFFEDGGCTVTVNVEHYVNTLKNFFLELHRKCVIMKKTWFQQDRATSYGTNVVLKILKEKLGQRIISCYTTLTWLPRSSDITPRDFLWMYVKSNVFESLVNDLVNVKTQIEAVIKGISQNCWRLLRKVLVANFKNVSILMALIYKMCSKNE